MNAPRHATRCLAIAPLAARESSLDYVLTCNPLLCGVGFGRVTCVGDGAAKKRLASSLFVRAVL